MPSSPSTLIFCLIGTLSLASAQSDGVFSSWNATAYTNTSSVISSTGSIESSSGSTSNVPLTTDATTAGLNATSIVTPESSTPGGPQTSAGSNGTTIVTSIGSGSSSTSTANTVLTNTSVPTTSTGSSISTALTPSLTPPLNGSVSTTGIISSGSSISTASTVTTDNSAASTTDTTSTDTSIPTTNTPTNGTIPTGSSSSETVSGTDSSSTTSNTGSSISDPSAISTTTANPGSTTGMPTITSTTTSDTSDLPPMMTTTASSASTQSVSTIDGVTTNTHVTTTDSDGHETVVPVLWGCPFCGGGGIELFGFGPGPGVFVWPPVPPFSGLPPVTLNNDNDPSVETTTGDPSSTATSTTSSSSSSCTSSTTTEELFVTCHETTTFGSSGLVTATASCETSTSTITGCDLTASATTTTATATATCWTYTLDSASLPDEGEPDAEDTTETKKRSIAGRIEYEVQETTSPNPSIVHGLVKRATDKTRIKKFGTCEIGGKEIKYPGWPGNNELQNKRNLITDQNPGGKIQQDQWWYRVKVGSCGEVSQLYHDPNFLPKPQVNEVNADHVFEKAIPRQFLDSLFTSNNPDQCSTFNGLFVDQTDANFPDDYKPKQGDPNTAKQIRLQSLFNRVPNNLNYNFVGLDKAVNGLKGTFFNPKLDGIEQPQAGGEGGQVDKNLNLWNRMGMVIDFLKMDVVQRVFVTGQSEVYAAFVRFDDLWGSCQDPINFAENYRKYIQGLLSDNIASIQQHASKVSNSLVQYATTTDSDGNLNSYGKAIRNLEQTYAPANLAFPTEPFLQFPETTADIKKRQAACTISAAPSTATSKEATTTAEATTSGGSAASASSASAASASSASAASVSSESVASVSSASVASVSSASVASVSSASVASVSSESVASVASASSASAASAAAASSAAAAVPTGDCYLWDYASLAYSIQVTPINNWSGDDGGSLKKEEKGCGALTSWEFGSWSNGTQWATFNLPILIKAGCVERAIKSAGGPEGLKCIGMGFFDGFIQEDGSIGEAVEDVDDDTLSGLGGLGGNKILAAVADDDETSSTGTSGPHGLPSAPSPTASMLPLAVPQN